MLHLNEPGIIYTMDIETITLEDFDNIQIPIAISSCSDNTKALFIIDQIELKKAIKNKSLIDIDNIVSKMFHEYLNYNIYVCTCYVNFTIFVAKQ